jgi:hypothetical protein
MVEGRLGYDYMLLTDQILSARYAYDNVRQYARTVDIGSQPSDSARFPLYPALTAAGLTDGTDLTSNTAFQPDIATFAVSEVGLKFTLTDLGRSGSVLGDSILAGEGGKAVLEKLTTDLCALGSGFSTVIGSTGNNLTEAQWQDGIVGLIGQKSPEDLFSILHERQYYDLINDIGTTVFSGQLAPGQTVPEQINRMYPGGGQALNLYGVMTAINPLIPTANGGADRAGFIAVRDRTIALVMKWAIRPEFERDASLRGTESVVTACYAVGEIEDATGVAVITDA